MAASVTTGRALRYAGGSARGLLHQTLGHYPAREWRRMLWAGEDPRPDVQAQRERADRGPTFDDAARAFHATNAAIWSAGHAQRWWGQYQEHLAEALGARPLDEITAGELLELLGPVWAEKHETGKRLVQRVGAVFDFAAGAGIFQGPNPTQGLRRALPKVRANVENFAAMPWRDVPAFWAALSDASITARALAFLILTAARSGEVRGARWAEIDLEVGLWTIPPERMKGREAHTVPLAPPAVQLLRAIEGFGAELVFPSPQAAQRGPAERPLSAAGFDRVLRRHSAGAYTAHGFRTSFRTWAAEVAGADREVAELCLAHRLGNRVEQAYNRTSLLDRRRVLMMRWAEHVTGAAGARVVHLKT